MKNALRTAVFFLFFILSARAQTRCIDIAPIPENQIDSEISKEQSATFAAEVMALKLGDQLVIKTSRTTSLTGTVSRSYMDVNFVEVRSGFLDDRLGHFRMTWDDDAVVGRVYDTMKPESYDIVKKIGNHPVTIDRLDVNAFNKKYPLACGNDEFEHECEINAGMVAANYDQKDDPAIWNDGVMVTQTFLVMYTYNTSRHLKDRGGINNHIAQGLELGNLCLITSGVPCTLVLGHSEGVDYVSQGNGSQDLSALGSNRKPFHNVRNLQCHYGCDIRTIVPEISNYGGLAYVASTASGMYDRDASHMVHVDYMAWHSWIHEIGHNMGGQHAIEQSYSAGPESGGLFGHSVGSFYTLRGDDSYGSIMSYAGHRTDNFCDTNAFIEGTPLGVDGRRNVARTWKKIRKYAANYLAKPKPSRIYAEESFNYKLDDSLMWQEGGSGWWEPWWTCSNKVFQITGGLSYPGLHCSGNAVYCDTWTSNAISRCGGNDPSCCDLRMPFINNRTNKPLWFSCLISRQNDDPNFFGVGLGRNLRFAKRADTDEIYLNGIPTGVTMPPFSTNLFLVKVDIDASKVYFWVDPDIASEPDVSTAQANFSYYATYTLNRVIIEGRKGAKFIVDEVRMGRSFEEVVAAQHPQEPKLEEGENALTFSFLGAPGEYDIFRSESEELSDRVKIATITSEGGRYSYVDAAPRDTVWYYMAAPKDAESEWLFTVPVSGLLGNLTQIPEPNGPYVVGQGQTNYFSAKGSRGWESAFRWQLRGTQSQMKTNNMYYAYMSTFTPGTYDVTLLMRSCRRPYDGIVTNYTTLTVTNSYPHVSVEMIRGDNMAKRPLTFRASPWDPGTNDVLEVRYQADESEEWTDWSRNYEFVHTYETSGDHLLKCQVRDNYGAVSETELPLMIETARAIPSFEDNIVVPPGEDHYFFTLRNLGTEPYEYEIEYTTDPTFFTVTPESGTVDAHGRSLLIRFNRIEVNDKTGLQCNFNVVIGGERTTVKLTFPPGKRAHLAINGNFDLFEGDALKLNNFGSRGCDSYRWLLDGEFISGAGAVVYQDGLESGEHSVVLEGYNVKGELAASVTNNFYVSPYMPSVYLTEFNKMGSSVTVWPRMASFREGMLIRFDWGEDAGYTTWQELREDSKFTHEFAHTGDHYVKCEVSLGEFRGHASLLFRPDRELYYQARIKENSSDEITVSAGERVTLLGEAGARNFWREDPMNPEIGLVEDPLAEETVCGPFAKPGTYGFIYYRADDEAVSAPQLLKVTVEPSEVTFSSFELNGMVITNTIYGEGPLGGCSVGVRAGSELYFITNRADGAFVFPTFQGNGTGSLTLNIMHPEHDGILTNVSLNSGAVFQMRKKSGAGYVYFNCTGERSALPLEGVNIKIAGLEGRTNGKGRSAAFTLPYGEYLAELTYPGMEPVVTNVLSFSQTTTCNVVMRGRQYVLSGMLYGTGGEIVTNGQIQVLNRETMNIAKRYNLEGLPFFDIVLGGTATTLRFRPAGYDNLNIDIALENNDAEDFVLTPEPLFITSLIFLLLLKLHHKDRS